MHIGERDYWQVIVGCDMHYVIISAFGRTATNAEKLFPKSGCQDFLEKVRRKVDLPSDLFLVFMQKLIDLLTVSGHSME